MKKRTTNTGSQITNQSVKNNFKKEPTETSSMGNNNSGNANHAFRINNNTGSAYGKRKEPMFIGRENTNSNSQGITNLNSVNSNPNLNLQTQANSSKHVMLGIEGTETSEIRGHSFDRIRQNSNSNAQYPNG